MKISNINFSTINYINLIIIHIALGFVIYIMPLLAFFYCIAIMMVGLFYIVKKQNKNNEVLLVTAYLIGAEVLLRSTDGVPVYEFVKYGVMFLFVVGMFYSGFSKNAIPYWVYLLLLIPGVVLSIFVLNASIEDRKLISFVISGPACLGICALYTYQRRINYQTMQSILICLGLPILTHTVFIILFTPSVRDVITGTDSNGQTSGGFGPNQVSTIIGLGIFIFTTRALLRSGSKFLIMLNLSIAVIMAYRGIVTFSRGGIYTCIVMIFLLVANVYTKFNFRAKVRLNYMVFILLGLIVAIWSYSILQTNGLISNRYSNKDSFGRVKETRLSGREDLAKSELNAFYSSPLVGVGVGKSIEIREQETGINSASHNEITRLLAEHGTLGILALLILFATPLFLHLDNRENFFMLPLFFFWLLTINHAAMRIAAPAFVYSLSLLRVTIDGAPRRKKKVFKGMSPQLTPPAG